MPYLRPGIGNPYPLKLIKAHEEKKLHARKKGAMEKLTEKNIKIPARQKGKKMVGSVQLGKKPILALADRKC